MLAGYLPLEAALPNFLFFLPEFLPLLLLELPLQLFPEGFLVLDVDYFFLSGFLGSLLQLQLFAFGIELALLVVVPPGNRFGVDFRLSKVLDLSTKNLFDSRDAQQKEAVCDFPDTEVFELENVLEVVLLVGADEGHEGTLRFLDIVAVR